MHCNNNGQREWVLENPLLDGKSMNNVRSFSHCIRELQFLDAPVVCTSSGISMNRN